MSAPPRRPPLLLALPFLLLALLPPFSFAQPSCPASSPHQASSASASAATYMVSLVVPAQQRRFPDGSVLSQPSDFHCAAVLLSPRWAAVPSACYDPHFAVVAYVAASSRAGGHRIPIESWLPADMPDNANHLVLVKLAADAPQNATFARVNTNPLLPEPSSYVRAVSYGVPKLGDDQHIIDMLPLRQAPARVVDTTLCPAEFGDSNSACSDNICAGWAVSASGCNGCAMGDDQALLSFDAAGNAVVLGMGAEDASRCGDAGLVTKFVRAERYVAWMQQQGVDFTASSDAVSVFDRPADLAPSPAAGSGEAGAPATNGAGGEAGADGKGGGGGVPLGAAIGAPVALVVAILVVAVIIRAVQK